jgi:hypothetical protein
VAALIREGSHRSCPDASPFVKLEKLSLLHVIREIPPVGDVLIRPHRKGWSNFPPLFCPSIYNSGIVMRIVTDTRLTLIQLCLCLHVKRKNAMKSNRQKNIPRKKWERILERSPNFLRAVFAVIKQMPYRAGLSHSEIFRRLQCEWNLILTRSFQIVLNVSCSMANADIYWRIIRTGGAMSFGVFYKIWVNEQLGPRGRYTRIYQNLEQTTRLIRSSRVSKP